ncbi:MAG: outer membrane lipoprotein carrier protein LolA [Acidobacteriota bacterium]
MSVSRAWECRAALVLNLMALGLLATTATAQGGKGAFETFASAQAARKSLAASFRQSYVSATLGEEIVEEGRLFFAAPGRLRLDYRRPDKKVFLVEPDGTTLSYVPADAAAWRSRLPAEAWHLELLRGRDDLADRFIVRDLAPDGSGRSRLELLPRGEDAGGVQRLELELDADHRRLKSILVTDELGNRSRLEFLRWKENPKLPDSTFRLRLPRGVILRDSGEGS